MGATLLIQNQLNIHVRLKSGSKAILTDKD